MPPARYATQRTATAEAHPLPLPLRRRATLTVRALCCISALGVLSCRLSSADPFESPSPAYAAELARSGGPSEIHHAGRRRQLLVATAGAATAASGALPSEAIMKTDEKVDEVLRVPANPRAGTRSYLLEKPKGFRRFASPVDPSGLVFRAIDDNYYTFITRAEKREGPEFTPQAFIDDYQTKFANSSGSAFELIKGGTKPDREDTELGIKYYEVEYIVRTQLGFSFDSLKSLHFITLFAAAPESIYILNEQALDEKWDVAEKTLKRISASFKITS